MSFEQSAGAGPHFTYGSPFIPQTAENMSRPSERDPEKEWMEKLFGECEDEFCETFGVYDGTFELIVTYRTAAFVSLS